MKTYRYIYYNLVLLLLRKKENPDDAKINAMLLISLLVFINFLNVFSIIVVASKKNLINLSYFNLAEFMYDIKLWGVGFFLSLVVYNYFFLARKIIFSEIIKEFEGKSEIDKKKGMVRTVFLLIISFGLPLFIAFFTTL